MSQQVTLDFRTLTEAKGAFARCLWESGLLRRTQSPSSVSVKPDVKELTISFQNIGASFDARIAPWFTIEDVATTALLGRACAEQGTKVNYIWPRRAGKTPSRAQKFLSGLGFYDLFQQTSDWGELGIV